MTPVMGVLVQILEQTWRFGNLFSLEASCMLPSWKLSSRSSPLLSPFLLWELHSRLSQREVLPCSFLWAFARFSQVLAVTPHRLLRVAGAAGRICCLLSLPHLKWHGLQLNLLLIGMHGRLPNCLESVRWELKTSGILILTQAFPALQHSIVRGQGGCPCMDRNQVTVPSRWEAGSSSFWHAQELLILVRICTASKVQSPLRNWIQSLKTNDFIVLLWFSNYFSSPTLFAVRMEP